MEYNNQIRIDIAVLAILYFTNIRNKQENNKFSIAYDYLFSRSCYSVSFSWTSLPKCKCSAREATKEIEVQVTNNGMIF